MSIIHGLFLFLILFWVAFLQCRRFVNTILSWILFGVIKKLFPQEDVAIKVDEFGYFCVKGIHISLNKIPLVKVSQITLEFVWDESLFGIKLQSTVSDLTFEKPPEENEKSYQSYEDNVDLKGSVTLGINLFSLHHPSQLLNIVPATEYIDGSEIESSSLTPVWLFARNGEACLQQNDEKFSKLTITGADAVVLYNSRMARLIILVKNGYVTCSPVSSGQIATSDGLILMYKFVDGELISSHSRLKHSEVELTPLVINTLETLLHNFTRQNTPQRHRDEEHVSGIPSEKSVENSSADNSTECEITFEAESITADIVSPDNSKRFQLKVAVVGLASPLDQLTNWDISIPFELAFFSELVETKQQVVGSKIKSEGLDNPCVLKAEGKESRDKVTKWNISFHQGILVQIKPQFVNMLESFYKAYEACSRKSNVESSECLEQPDDGSSEKNVVDQKTTDQEGVATSKHEIFEISASISEITIDVFDVREENLLQIMMLSPQFSMSQDLVKRSLNFSIGNLKGYNCLEDIPFFHPTNENDEENSLLLSIEEELTNDQNKLSFKNFTFGSCNTTVVVEETLIFAVLKDFGLHKKVAQIFFQRREERRLNKPSSFTQRFSFDYLELRAVEVILTLLPAIELPIDLQVIKNNLGIPHQLPPRFENASLNFDPFVRNNIQYSSYKFISNDIKKHYLKELGSQSARVLGSMHLLGNISRLKQDIMTGFTTLRETGEFITFFRQVTSGVASSYSKFTGSWSDLFAMSYSPRPECRSLRERRLSEPGDLDLTTLQQISENECSTSFQRRTTTPSRRAKDDTDLDDNVDESDGIWFPSSVVPDVVEDQLYWDTESGSSDGEGGLIKDLIPKNVKKQLKGQEFLRRLKENLGDNEHGEVFSCCLKVRKNVETKLNALLSNRKVYFLKGRPSHESLVLCIKYEMLYRAQYMFQDKTHYLQLIKKMKGIKALSIPSRSASENPLVRCDNIAIARKVALKINELKQAYDHEYMHTQHL